jgi:hypothetical protein
MREKLDPEVEPRRVEAPLFCATVRVGFLFGIAFRMRQDGLRPENRIEVQQQPAEGIVNVADEVHADLIALATHGRSGLSRLVFDSVADKVVRSSTRPILVYRPPPWEGAGAA